MIEPAVNASLASASQSAAAKSFPMATPRGPQRKLCVGMSTFDDYDGVYFSIQAIRMYHAEVADQLQYLVIDNNPGGPCAPSLKALEKSVDNYRYVPQPDAVGCIARDYIAGEANSDYVLVMDCHVLLVPGALRRLIEYFDTHPTTNDLVQGPLIEDDLKTCSTHFEAAWSKGMYGRWGTDSRGLDPDGEPFDIPMQGCGTFAYRRAAWPGFNQRFRGFGAEEGYIHEKFRQAGGRTLCAPFLRWMHRFNRPMGVPYPNRFPDRIRNHMIGWKELGWELAPIKSHFSDLLGAVKTEAICVRVEAEMSSALFAYDSVFYLPGVNPDASDAFMLPRFFERLYIADRVIRLASSASEVPQAIGRVLSYRAVVERAIKARLETVLVVERIEEITENIESMLRSEAEELRKGGADRFVHHSVQVDRPSGDSNIVAISLHKRLFAELLELLPDSVEAAEKWLLTQDGLERCLAER